MEVDEALVDAHLEAVPGVGALTAWALARGDAQSLGGQTHWARDAQVLVQSSVLQIAAHCKMREQGHTQHNTRPLVSKACSFQSSSRENGLVWRRTLLEALHVTAGQNDTDAVHAIAA